MTNFHQSLEAQLSNFWPFIVLKCLEKMIKAKISIFFCTFVYPVRFRGHMTFVKPDRETVLPVWEH